MKVLSDIGAGEIPYILVLNKIDLVDLDTVQAFLSRYPGSVAVSAKQEKGLESL